MCALSMICDASSSVHPACHRSHRVALVLHHGMSTMYRYVLQALEFSTTQNDQPGAYTEFLLQLLESLVEEEASSCLTCSKNIYLMLHVAIKYLPAEPPVREQHKTWCPVLLCLSACCLRVGAWSMAQPRVAAWSHVS